MIATLEHVLALVAHGTGKRRAVCTCGWQSPAYRAAASAIRDLCTHELRSLS